MIKTEYITHTLAGESQEINIFKAAEDDKWSISCTIPKFARKYRKFLEDGREVINSNHGQLVEIHGTLNNKGVSLTAAREMSEEDRKAAGERLNKLRMSETSKV
ncbi:hypothetical protein [Lactococcus formosensis]|uniref:hypothetical protein n=1 Tax=Lactococcus formosensis TaxID=1281486 RepID=UPI0032676C41